MAFKRRMGFRKKRRGGFKSRRGRAGRARRRSPTGKLRIGYRF